MRGTITRIILRRHLISRRSRTATGQVIHLLYLAKTSGIRQGHKINNEPYLVSLVIIPSHELIQVTRLAVLEFDIFMVDTLQRVSVKISEANDIAYQQSDCISDDSPG